MGRNKTDETIEQDAHDGHDGHEEQDISTLSPRIRVCCEGDVSKGPLLAYCSVFYSSRNSRAVHGQFTAQFTACTILCFSHVLRCDGMVATYNYKIISFIVPAHM